MPTKYPCKICYNPVAKNHKEKYNLLKEDKTTWYCIYCSKDLFLSLALLTMISIQQFKVKKLCNHS